MEQLAREGQHWQSSAGMVDDIIQTADASYASLREQRQRLRGASRVVADMADALGLTQTTMKIIARRDITDAYLIAAGMVVTLIVLYVTWFM
jgi:golgi SNAP receptor complex member 2